VRLKAILGAIGGIGVTITIPAVIGWLHQNPIASLGLSAFVLAVVALVAGRFRSVAAIENEQRFVGDAAIQAIIVSVENAIVNLAGAFPRSAPAVRIRISILNTCPFRVEVHLDSFEVLSGLESGHDDDKLRPLAITGARRDVSLEPYERVEAEELLFPVSEDLVRYFGDSMNKYFSHSLTQLRYVLSVSRDHRPLTRNVSVRSPATITIDARR